MKITHLDLEPIYEIPYQNVPPGRSTPWKGIAVDAQFPVLAGTVDHLPKSLDALIVTSDLQGMINGQLMGETIPAELAYFLTTERPAIDPKRTGVLLGGDLFALSFRRGGLGPVDSVWRAFGQAFKWVVGVAGNHDLIRPEDRQRPHFRGAGNLHFLAHHNHTVDQLKIAGLSGIIGNKRKENRHSPATAQRHLQQLHQQRADLLLLHEGPSFPGQYGSPQIREVLEQYRFPLVCCGHRHTDQPLQTLANGTQILNTEGRVVILGRELE